MNGCSRLKSGQDPERHPRDAEQLAIVRRDHVGRAGAVVDEGDFAKKIGGTKESRVNVDFRRVLNSPELFP